ncbi:MAG: hypothetical protein QOJ52_293 [Acidimicrobiaceae bacterium]|nr:hypothetical protein [Acidimicrobiaceae bacterium]MDQ1418331.1 hypothetical protein [Acidimicrobiaceae bacterium]
MRRRGRADIGLHDLLDPERMPGGMRFDRRV